MERGAPSSVTGPCTPNLIIVDVSPVVSPPVDPVPPVPVEPLPEAAVAEPVPDEAEPVPPLLAAGLPPAGVAGAGAPPGSVELVTPLRTVPPVLEPLDEPFLDADAVVVLSPDTLTAPMTA